MYNIYIYIYSILKKKIENIFYWTIYKYFLQPKKKERQRRTETANQTK